MSIKKNTLVDLYCKKQMTMLQISEVLNCSLSTVNKYLKKHNIETRRPGKKSEDLTGDASGYLTVEKMIQDEDTISTRCFCRCECGNTRVVKPTQIKNKIITSCGCQNQNRKGENSKTWRGHGGISGTHWRTICNNFKRRKNVEEFSINIEYVWDLFCKQKGKCALSGFDINFAEDRRSYQKGETTASLDRIDPSKGYIHGNVQWIHKDVNKSKYDFTQERYVELCRSVAKYHAS